MSKFSRIATSLIAVTMMTAPMVMAAQTQNQTQNSTQNDWTTPPAGTEQGQAYKDGIEAAKLDTVAKRPVDPKTSYLYNHPPVKKSADREAYRSSFTEGYKAALAHNNGNGGM
ncbi:hypothetical protein GOB94_05745 [Granulicella sp. 5B5]|uniref:hypothetical protein n=1 Tax=Granulicella sp. 5B5 TaxID=1617967 RepID=UPI0015F64B0D|nr:hypothetical protein [Granulicella sp. 5B5]QMV18248.1 hypothetical protein GOB94_05745 [Granulicella sp. 5B5]